MLFSVPFGWSIEPAFRDEMDGARPVLQLHDPKGFKVLEQYIDRETKRLEAGWEIVRLQGPAGESAHLTFNLPQAPVIDELQISARIRCTRPGSQLAARVILPRSRNSKTGEPHEMLLRGSNMSRGLPEETLLLKDVPKLLQRQARVLRLQTDDVIDERGAYVNQLVFLVPGGNGTTEFAVDCIELFGIIQPRQDSHVQLTSAEEETLFDGPRFPGADGQASTVTPNKEEPKSATRTSVHRIIRWQGEQFEYLAKIGFSAVWMLRTPSEDELRLAGQAGISIVCPPPSKEVLTQDGITSAWDPVMAWHLGQMLTHEDLARATQVRQLIQQHDPNPLRSTLMSCGQLTRDASRATDAIMLGRELLGTDLSLQEYVIWLGQRQRIVRPGTPTWVLLESELSPQRSRQIAALSDIAAPLALCASYEQLAAVSAAAMSIRCRDYVFTSNSSLENDSPATHQRARNLELVNLRLRLLSPWINAGKVMGSGHCSEPGLSAIVFQAERSHLLIPINWSRNFRSQQAFHAPGPVSIVVPGVAETTDVHLLTLAGTRRLRHERTTGGLKIEIESLPADAMILITSDAEAFSQVSKYLRAVAPRAVKLHRDCAAHRCHELESALAQIPEQEEKKKLSALLAQGKQYLSACDRDLASGFEELAYQRIDKLQRLLSHAEYLIRSVHGMTEEFPTPLDFHIATSGIASKLMGVLANENAQRPLLEGGDFENLNDLLQNGWQHQQLQLSGITSAVRLSPDDPYQGTYCLELEAANSNPSVPITVVPTAPVWINSPAIPLSAGETIEIRGVARVPEAVVGSVDGLQVIDSLGGPGMATRILLSNAWRPFRIMRAADSDTQLTISLALTGLGRAQVDNLQVRKLERRSAVAQQLRLLPQ